LAKNLLRHFGSVERVFAASEEELKAVALVGPKTAERIRELVGGEYKCRKRQARPKRRPQTKC